MTPALQSNGLKPTESRYPEYLILKKWAPLSAIQFPLSIQLSWCFLLHLAVINWLNVPGFGLYSRRWVKAWKRVLRLREEKKQRKGLNRAVVISYRQLALRNYWHPWSDAEHVMWNSQGWHPSQRLASWAPTVQVLLFPRLSSKQQAPLWRDYA